MSLNNFTNQTIGLAGISQAAALVQQLATTGKADAEIMEASIGSLLKIDSGSVEGVFGGISHLKLGLEQFQQQITGYNIENRDLARYGASLVFLERQLNNQPEMLQTIHKGIKNAQQQTEHFELMHENVLANLGDLYFNTISTIQPRIMVNGDEQFLQRPETVNKIRTLLLAGVRSAMLWRQCGGARWKFLFYRKKLQDEVKFLLTKV